MILTLPYPHSAFASSLAAGIPSLRYLAATQWARLSLKDDSSTALDGYGAALALIPSVAWLGQTISDRRKQLLSIGGLERKPRLLPLHWGSQRPP